MKKKPSRINGAAEDIGRILFSLAEDSNGLAGAHNWRKKTLALHHEYEAASSDCEKSHLLIKMIQCQRDAGACPPDHFLSVLSRCIESISDGEDLQGPMFTDPKLKEIHAKIDAIEKREGLKKDEYWKRADGPEDWQELNHQWERRADEIHADLMRQYGEYEAAALLLNDKEEFRRRHEISRRFWADDPDGKKLEALTEEAARLRGDE